MRNDSPLLLLPGGLPSIYERGVVPEHGGPSDPESNEVERKLEQFLAPIYLGAPPSMVRYQARTLGDVTSGVRSSSPWIYARVSTGVDEPLIPHLALRVAGELLNPLRGVAASIDQWCEDFDALDWGPAREAVAAIHTGIVAIDLRGSLTNLTNLATCAEQLVAELDTVDLEPIRETVAAMQRGTLWLQGLVGSLLATRALDADLVGQHLNVRAVTQHDAPERGGDAPYAAALKWLEEAIGLNKTEIADLLDVTRQTLYNWHAFDPVRPWPRHVERLLKIKEILERARENHSQPGEVKTWLLTPRRSNGATPFDLIRSGRLDEARYAAIARPSARLAEPLHRPARRPNDMYRSGDDLARRADAPQPSVSVADEHDPHEAS